MIIKEAMSKDGIEEGYGLKENDRNGKRRKKLRNDKGWKGRKGKNF